MPRRGNHWCDNGPLVVVQIAGITQAGAVRSAAMFGCPHGALLRESSAQQGITSDSSDSNFPDRLLEAAQFAKSRAKGDLIELRDCATAKRLSCLRMAGWASSGFSSPPGKVHYLKRTRRILAKRAII